jgi:phage host-nuclease inhibitor protein Gam
MNTNQPIKIQFRAAQSREEIETLVGAVAGIVNQQRRLSAQMDEEVAALRARYEEPLAGLAADLAGHTATLKQWAQAHPEEFAKRKSIEFVQGTLGFRTGSPRLTLRSRKWNWDEVVRAIKTRNLPGFLRAKEEVDKERILGLAAGAPDLRRFNRDVLEPIGVKITREESFFVNPKLTELDARQVEAA